jgi:hypothetical protein
LDFTNKYGRWIILAALVMVIGLLLIRPFAQFAQRIPLNYNEGWNAYYADRAYGSAPLYPAGEEWLFDNYPPLSFYIFGAFGQLIGDNIIAGRLISLLSFIAVAAAIGLIVRRLGGGSCGSLFAALLFAGHMLFVPGTRFLANEPQMLAHALVLFGAWIFIAYERSWPVLLAVALLFFLGGLIKHMVVPLPLAVTIWLGVYDRRRFVLWSTTCLVLLAIALLLMYAAFGGDAFTGILFTPRVYAVGRIAWMMKEEFILLTPLYALWMLLLTARKPVPKIRLVDLYILCATVWGLIALGGDGIDVNAIFDIYIALSVAAGLGVHWIARRLARPDFPRGSVQALLMLVLSLSVFLRAPLGMIGDYRYISQLDAHRSTAAQDIEYIKDKTDPVICENLALCYWARREFAVDLFNAGQLMKKSERDADRFVKLIRQGRFPLIQIEGRNGMSRRIPEEVNVAIQTHYRVDRVSLTGGYFYVPKKLSG